MSASTDPAAPDAPAEARFAGRLAGLAAAPRRILYLGASVTAQKRSYCHALHELLREATGQPHEFHRIAEGGGSSVFALGSLLQALRGGARYDIVFLETLTGDLNLLAPETAVPAALGAIADAVWGQGGELCLVKLPRMDRPPDHPITLAYDATAGALGLPVLDLTGFGRPAEGSEPLSRIALRDGLHTTDGGAALLGAALASQLLSPDRIWPARAPARDIGAPLRARFAGLRLFLDELDVAPADGLRRDSFAPPSGGEPYPVLVAPHNTPIRFSFAGYVAYFLFVSAPDSGVMTLDFHKFVRRTASLDRHGHFPHLHMKPLFREFRRADEIVITALDEIPEPNPVPAAHRHRLLPDRVVRFLGVLGVADGA